MPKTLLLVGTRKGAFLLESDADRRDWNVRGPFCEGWPVYHAVHDASDGLDLRRRRERVARLGGLAQQRPGRDLDALERRSSATPRTRPQGVEGLDARGAHGRVLVGVEAPGIFESKDGGETFSLLTTLAGQPGSEEWDDPANQPPGHLGISALMSDKTDDSRFWAIVQGVGLFETTDDGSSWTPRNRGLRADWPRPHEEVGFCVHKLVRSPADPDRMYQQNHVGMHRSDDGGHSWTEITEGLPTEFGFAAAAHPHDRDTFYVDPARPRATGARCRTARRRSGARSDAGSSWQRSRPRAAAGGRAPRRAARGDGDRRPTTCPASTSARAPASSSRAPTRARAGTRSRATCRRSGRSRSRWSSSRWPSSASPRR